MNIDTETIRHAVQPLNGSPADYDGLLELCANARVVLIGEATHGTHEFYSIRCAATVRLLSELGFHGVAIEADWPDTWRLNRFVKGVDEHETASDALAGFRRFPQWMWRNSDILDFAGWMLDHNSRFAGASSKRGIYGLDIYSLNESMKAVIDYLTHKDPAAAREFSHRYACFDHFGGDVRKYGLFTGTGAAKGCENEVVGALAELRRSRASYLAMDGHAAEEDFFQAERNANVVADAEKYYRTMLRGDVQSWNLRDRHMVDTLLALMDHLDRIHEKSRLVIWAHNSHVGNAQATEMSKRGEFNIGQLCRERFGNEAVLIGFTTYAGTVTAASQWDGPAEHMELRPALPQSIESVFHHSEIPSFWLDFKSQPAIANMLREPVLERAVGVIYSPETERRSHYFKASVPDQFDAVFHIDTTRAVEPLERTALWQPGELEETYPTGL
jgi:erythromycin esterase-like protein